MKQGLLLVNLGTPDAPKTAEVRRYLAQFLMDPYVIDIPALLRLALVYGVILPRRPALSAAAYAKIWTDRGSPLLFHSQDLARKVQAQLGESVNVELGMRYGGPSLDEALARLRARGSERVKVFPLYPQYSLAATESSLAEIKKALQRMRWTPEWDSVPAFYSETSFIRAWANNIRPLIEAHDPDCVLFSFHGLPERQVKKTDLTDAHCLASKSCCDQIVEANRNCYRAQSFATARLLAQELGLAKARYEVSFQSRLGRTPWIRPYTDELYPQLAAKGVKKLLVVCPAFVADCLETLEEVEMRGRADFLKAGGEALWMAPSLNSDTAWVESVVRIALARA